MTTKTKKKPRTSLNCHGKSVKKIGKILETYDRLSGNFGVESVRSSDSWDNYYQDIRFLYSNAGDSYHKTLVYDTKKDKLFLTDIGGLLEKTKNLC